MKLAFRHRALFWFGLICMPVAAIAADAQQTGTQIAQQLGEGGSLFNQLRSLFPSENDPFRRLISSIFGDAGGLGYFGGSTPIGEMFMAFNACLMVIMGAWMTWIAFKTAVNSAHDGDFLGKQYHSAWVPVRISTSVIGLTPLPFLSGWNLAQGVMALAMLVAGGIGNIVATHSVTHVQTIIKKNVATPTIPDVTEVGRRIQSARIDLLVLQNTMAQRIADGVDPSTTGVQFAYQIGTSQITDQNGAPINATVLTFGANPPQQGYSAVRGKIVIPEIAVQTTDPDMQTLQQAVNAAIRTAVQTMAQQIDAEYTAIVGVQMPSSGASPSDDVVDVDTRTVARNRDTADANVTRIINDAQASVRAQVLAAVGNINTATAVTTQSFLQNRSWMGVGYVFPYVSTRNKEANAITSGASGKVEGSGTAELCEGICHFKKAWEATKEAASAVAGGATAAYEAALAAADFASNPKKWMDDKMRDLMAKGGILGTMQEMAVGTDSPTGTIAMLSALGSKIILLCIEIEVWLTVAVFATSIIPMVSISTAVASVQNAISPLISLAFIQSMALTTVIPFVPFLLWMGAIASYLMICAEALIAAPLWALAHMEDSGDGMGQRAQHGYVYIFTVAFGPAVLVIGYTFATAMFEYLAGEANGFISRQLVKEISGTDSFFLSLIYIVGALFLLLTTMISLVYTCYSMPVQMAQKVFTWIGGEFGANVVSDLGGAAKQAAGQAEQAGHTALESKNAGIQGAGNTAGAAASDGAKGLNRLAAKVEARGAMVEGAGAGETNATSADSAGSGSAGDGYSPLNNPGLSANQKSAAIAGQGARDLGAAGKRLAKAVWNKNSSNGGNIAPSGDSSSKPASPASADLPKDK